MDDNYTELSDDEIEDLWDLACSDAEVAEECTGQRRSYTCKRSIVRREDGSLWALEYNDNEVHRYATDAYEVEAVKKTITVYERTS